MTTIAQGSELLKRLISEGKIKPALPTPPTSFPVPSVEPGLNPLLRGPTPPNSWNASDMTRQFHQSAVPQTRVLPISSIANPVVGAQAASQAILIQSTTTTSTSTSSGTDNDIISGTNRQTFGSFDSASSKTDNSGTVNSISTTTFAATANELAVAIATARGNVATFPGLTPGTGWASLAAGGAWQKVIPTAGSLTATQAFGGTGLTGAQALAIFKTNGGTPVFTLHGGGSGGSTVTSSTWTPTVGNSIIFVATTGEGFSTPFAPTVTDTQGNVYVLIENPFTFVDQGGGLFKSSQCVIYYAQNVKGASTTATAKTNNGSRVFGDWSFYEVSNIGNIASGSYTFQSSDANKLVQFSGGADVTATLPSPALAAGWEAVASNNSPGTLTIVPASGVFLNGSTAGVVIPSSGSTWLFSDGTNYWSTTIALPLNTPLIAHQQLTSYNPITGAFGQGQTDFTDLSGQATNAQLPSAISVTTVAATGGFSTGSNLNTNGSGVMTSYNGRATAGGGLTAIEATVDSTTNGANIGSTTLYAVPGSGIYSSTYRIAFYLSVTRAATTSSTLPDIQFTATDTDTSTVITYGPFAATVPTGNSLSTAYSGDVIVRGKQSTNITYQVGNATQFASAGGTSMQYSLHLRLEGL